MLKKQYVLAVAVFGKYVHFDFGTHALPGLLLWATSLTASCSSSHRYDYNWKQRDALGCTLKSTDASAALSDKDAFELGWLVYLKAKETKTESTNLSWCFHLMLASFAFVVFHCEKILHQSDGEVRLHLTPWLTFAPALATPEHFMCACLCAYPQQPEQQTDNPAEMLIAIGGGAWWWIFVCLL